MSYNMKWVREGNWTEEYARERETLAWFRERKIRRELNLQATTSLLFKILTTPTTIRNEHPTLWNGVDVQIMANEVDEVLSVVTPQVNLPSGVPEGSLLAASCIISPCLRNTFRIILNPHDLTPRPDQPIKYGDRFYIMIATIHDKVAAKVEESHITFPPDVSDQPLYIQADWPFGTLTGRQNMAAVRLSTHSDNQARFYAEHPVDEFAEGLPVEGGSPIRIISAATGRSLVTDPANVFITMLGTERPAALFSTDNKRFQPPPTMHVMWRFLDNPKAKA